MLGIRFSEDEGITVPYPAMGGNHYGFSDFRGDPDGAEKVPEAVHSAGLRSLLRRFATDSAPLFTVGCELGGSNNDKEHTAGGYVHMLARDYADKTEAQYKKFLDGVFWDLRELSGDDHWAVEATSLPVRVLLDDRDVTVPSVMLNVHAIADAEADAVQSRERLFSALEACLFGRAIQFLGYASG